VCIPLQSAPHLQFLSIKRKPTTDILYIGDYRDESGGYGNVNTGKYSSAVSNGAASTSAAASTKAASSTKTSTATITGASNTATAATAGASQATSVTSASAAASATAKGQAEHLRVNAGVGLLGLVLGLVL
jgi:hypothetical protein